MPSHFEQARINQLLSAYAPHDPPRLGLDFGDYLSLLWRLDRSAALPARSRYYRQCACALASALNFKAHPLGRLVETTEAGEIYRQLANLPYRTGSRLLDANDRRAAIAQLTTLREDILRMGTYSEHWGGGWPGSGILETEVRERVFAVLFTALQGQFSNFARLLLVIDIVLADILLGASPINEVALAELVARHDYPDPTNPRVQRDFNSDP